MAITVQIRLAPGEVAVVDCDECKGEDVEEGSLLSRRLRLYKSGKVIGEYKWNSILGYHFYEK